MSSTESSAETLVNGMRLPPNIISGEESSNKRLRLDGIDNSSIVATTIASISQSVTICPKVSKNVNLDSEIEMSPLHLSPEYKKALTTLEKSSDKEDKNNGEQSPLSCIQKINISRDVSIAPKISPLKHPNLEDDVLMNESLHSPKSDVSMSLEEALLNGEDLNSDTESPSKEKYIFNKKDSIDNSKIFENSGNSTEVTKSSLKESGKSSLRCSESGNSSNPNVPATKNSNTQVNGYLSDSKENGEVMNSSSSKGHKTKDSRITETKESEDEELSIASAASSSSNTSIRSRSSSIGEKCSQSGSLSKSEDSSSNSSISTTHSKTSHISKSSGNSKDKRSNSSKSSEKSKAEVKKQPLNGSVLDAKQAALTFTAALKDLEQKDSLMDDQSALQPLKPAEVLIGDAVPSLQNSKLFQLKPMKVDYQGVKRSSSEEGKPNLKKFRKQEKSGEIKPYKVTKEELKIKTKSELEDSKKNVMMSKLRKIKRKDLENLMLEAFMDKILYEHELGSQRDLCKRLEATLESSRKKAAQFHKEIDDLKKVTLRLESEHQSRKGQVVTPVKVKRSVGIQATPAIITKGIMHASTSSGIKLLTPRVPPTPSHAQQQQQQQVRSINSHMAVALAPTKPSITTTLLNKIPISIQSSLPQVRLDIPSGGKFTTIQGARFITTSQSLQPKNTVNSSTQSQPMVMINPTQFLPVAQQTQNGGSISIPVGARLVQAPLAQSIPQVKQVSPTSAPLTVVPRSTNSSVIDLTDDEEISKTNRLPVTIVQRNNTTASSQYVTLPSSSVGSFLLVPSNNGQPGGGPTLLVNKLPGNPSVSNASNLSTIIQSTPTSRVTTTVSAPQNTTSPIVIGASSLPNLFKHPSPLPKAPIQQTAGISGMLPPQPLLKLSHKNNSIVLSWNMEKTDQHENISSYQLYAYQEGTAPPTPSLWKKVGSVKALDLPMACTLTQFMPGHVYHFAVRAVDIRNRVGSFSIPRSIKLGGQ